MYERSEFRVLPRRLAAGAYIVALTLIVWGVLYKFPISFATENTLSTIPPVTLAAVFNRDLKYGMTGTDVQVLQRLLNNLNFTVAQTGGGSPGNETTKFGVGTRAALTSFQKSYKITPTTGYFGPLTRAQANTILDAHPDWVVTSSSAIGEAVPLPTPSSVSTLSDLELQIKELRAEIARVAGNATAQGNSNFQAIALSNRIDNLSGTTISNPVITGGSITNTPISGSTISGTTLSVSSGTVSGNLTVSGVATSTFTGGINTSALNVTSTTATSTFANGISLSGGCFSMNDRCITSRAFAYMVTNAVPTSIPTGTSYTTKLVFNEVVTDTLGTIANLTNNRLIVPTGYKFARITASVAFSGNTAGYRAARIYKNGVTNVGNQRLLSVDGTTSTNVQPQTPWLSVRAGDYFELYPVQTSGANLDAGSDLASSWMMIDLSN